MMKIVRWVPLALCLLSLAVLRADTECTSGRTTIVVKDCDGAVVSGARVEIEICCGGNRTESQTTGSSGEAHFQVSRKDICGRRISLAGFAESKGALGGCSGDDSNSTCEVAICPR